MNDFSLSCCLLMSMIGHTKTYYCSIDLIQFTTKIYKRISNPYSIRELPNIFIPFELENSFSSKSQNCQRRKISLEKNRSKTGERAHIDTENRTMKSAQQDFWSHIYILLVAGFMYYIIVNNTIFFEMTYPCV